MSDLLRANARMCVEYSGTMHCPGCPIRSAADDADMECFEYIVRYSDEAEKIISRWAEENPEFTLSDMFGAGKTITITIKLDGFDL